MAITFGKTGVCTRPAERAVEGYSPRDGLAHGELDRVVYACEEHREEARTVWLAGLTAHALPRSATTTRTCGSFTDFTAPDDPAA
ncbi:hypothetical protein ACFQ7O_35650 [Streptomyces sp. NPDC056485]|uniref:hypothetical protein n=1 Tax=Streptomyces sp. NPDC056485 TaxID=3345834 RepID=UPI00367E72BD